MKVMDTMAQYIKYIQSTLQPDLQSKTGINCKIHDKIICS